MAAGKADKFCKEWKTVNLTVNLLEGPLYSALLIDDVTGAKVNVCNDVNATAFWDIYL